MTRKLYLVNKAAEAGAYTSLLPPQMPARMGEEAIFLVGAVEDGRPVGAAVLEVEQTQAQLLWIAVAQGHRRQGLGMAMLGNCVELLRRVGIQRLYAVTDVGDPEGEALLRAFGLSDSEAGAFYSFALSAVQKLAVLRGEGVGVTALKAVPDTVYRAYLQEVFPGDPQIGRRALFDQQLSQLFLEGGRITASLLVHKTQEGLSVGWAASKSVNKWALLELLRGVLHTAQQLCPPQTQVTFAAYRPAVIALADKLLGDAAEKTPIRSWELAGYRFRLYDTSATQWKER